MGLSEQSGNTHSPIEMKIRTKQIGDIPGLGIAGGLDCPVLFVSPPPVSQTQLFSEILNCLILCFYCIPFHWILNFSVRSLLSVFIFCSAQQEGWLLCPFLRPGKHRDCCSPGQLFMEKNSKCDLRLFLQPLWLRKNQGVVSCIAVGARAADPWHHIYLGFYWTGLLLTMHLLNFAHHYLIVCLRPGKPQRTPFIPHRLHKAQ